MLLEFLRLFTYFVTLATLASTVANVIPAPIVPRKLEMLG
jgi:hypothetical protein